MIFPIYFESINDRLKMKNALLYQEGEYQGQALQ